MKWLIAETVRPVAGRIGGQTAAFLVGVGMAAQHESAVAAVVAWIVVTVAESVFSSLSRRKLIRLAKESWGRN